MGTITSSYYRAIQEVGFQPFIPITVQQLSEGDFDKKIEFCETMLLKIIWSDKSQFTLNGIINHCNCCYWAYSNQHKQTLMLNLKNGVMMWCRITSGGLTKPYFFEVSLTGDSYLQMLFCGLKLNNVVCTFNKMGHLANILVN